MNARSVHALFAATLCLAWWIGCRGLDLGYHWDEHRLVDSVVAGVARGSPLPGWYNYPSLPFDLTALTATPEIVTECLSADPLSGRERLSRFIQSKALLFRARLLFLTLTLLSSVWVYLTVRALEPGLFPAFLAGAANALSWELGYHARWLAPDGLVVTFAALTVLLVVRSLSASDPRGWLAAATVAAGLTTASKYTGGLVLVPVLLVAGRRTPRAGVSVGLIMALFIAVNLLVSPGLLFECRRAFRDIVDEGRHYAVRGHGGHTTAGPIDHLGLIVEYAVCCLVSPFRPVSLALSALAAVGAASLARRDSLAALTVLVVPVAWVLLFSSMKVMIARNLLVLLPFLCICAALGVADLKRWVRTKPWLSVGLPVATVAALALNVAWSVRAVRTIENRSDRDIPREFVQYASDHPDRSIELSPGMFAALGTAAAAYRPAPGIGKQRWFAFLPSEFQNRLAAFPVHRFHYTLLDSGPYEVNWDCYPNWEGDDRVVMVPLENALSAPKIQALHQQEVRAKLQ